MNGTQYQKELDAIAKMEAEKIATQLLKSIIDAVQCGLCRFKFRLEID